ncbi:helix-turn-helix transcriptional regulator [Labrys sp. LIt4]|uniref:helix-turn-helix domain-containing protein n=1 Tax=Labrys sp. LIt4 TaxID=2821355 RepID=UPI001AE0449F|nr:helix-turn-helix transcriptional regulator [Labrys sp. LIt4]MBP0581075.1 helix-turn-helix transcriptional regulator [Labrys sp. LIt4]
MNAIEQGRALRRLRMLKGIKQSHLAELLGVDQASISRWERGIMPLGQDRWVAILDLLAATPVPAEDAALKRLVASSTAKVHLICDHSHRLLAASLPRQAEWHVDLPELLGRSLLPYASDEILAAEERLAARGWHEGYLASLTLETGANGDPVLPIEPSRVLWERVRLADGSAGRLVTTVT